MNKLFLGLVALMTIVLIACGGGDSNKAPTVTTDDATPAATTAPVVLDETWATEQVLPYQKVVLEIMRDQDWNRLYDSYSTESKAQCSRTEFVGNMAGT